MVPGLSNRICSQDQSKICQNQPKTPKVNMLKSGDVSFDFGFEWCLGLATGYVAKMLILATYPSANSPSWPPCPGTFGTLFGTFGTFGTCGTFGSCLAPDVHRTMSTVRCPTYNVHLGQNMCFLPARWFSTPVQ